MKMNMSADFGIWISIIALEKLSPPLENFGVRWCWELLMIILVFSVTFNGTGLSLLKILFMVFVRPCKKEECQDP
jgi:hypothetical protein